MDRQGVLSTWAKARVSVEGIDRLVLGLTALDPLTAWRVQFAEQSLLLMQTHLKVLQYVCDYTVSSRSGISFLDPYKRRSIAASGDASSVWFVLCGSIVRPGGPRL